MNNTTIATLSNKDFTIGADGAFISQTRIAELLGVNRTTVNMHISNKTDTYNTNELNQLDAESLAKLTAYYAAKGKENAIALLAQFAVAGAQAFIYNEAGLTIEVTDPESDTRIDRLENMTMQLMNKVASLTTPTATPTTPPTPRHPPVAIMRSTPVKQEKLIGDQLFTCMEFRNTNGYHNMDHALASVLGTRAQHIWYNTGTPLVRKSGRNAYPVEIWQQAINEVNAGVGVFSEASVKIIY